MNKGLKTAKKIFAGNIKNVEPLVSYIKQHKIVVFVPLKNADELAFAMASKGAGVIGNYTVCSFRIKGIGTFIGGNSSNPKAGKKGSYEMAEEIRLEMVCPAEQLDKVVNKIYEVHPYEEPAFEIYDIMTRTSSGNDQVILVTLKKTETVKNVIKRLDSRVDIEKIPQKIYRLKIKHAVMDHSETDNVYPKSFGKGTLYLRKKNNVINIEIK
jgi:hypothetical protein